MKQLLTLPGEAEQFEHYGEVYVTRQAYADLNEHSALVEMNLQAQIDLNEAYEARLLAENERLRGIVQADIEEKAEAWGEVERLRAAIEWTLQDMYYKAPEQVAESAPAWHARLRAALSPRASHE